MAGLFWIIVFGLVIYYFVKRNKQKKDTKTLLQDTKSSRQSSPRENRMIFQYQEWYGITRTKDIIPLSRTTEILEGICSKSRRHMLFEIKNIVSFKGDSMEVFKELGSPKTQTYNDSVANDIDAYLLAEESLKYVDEERPRRKDKKRKFIDFDDPYIETAAKFNRDNPIIITFVYEREDEEGNIISSQERAVQPYYRDEDYLEGYCLDYEAERTFRIDRIVRFTGNSKAIFDELDVD